MYYLLMNIMVFVLYTQPGIICESRPNSFPYYVPHTLLCLGVFMRYHISIIFPYSSSKNTLIICVGNFLLVIIAGVNFSFAVSTHASIASWVNDQKRVVLLLL